MTAGTMSGRANGRFLKLVGFVVVVLGIVCFLVIHHNVRSQLSDAQKQLQELQNDNQDLMLKLRGTYICKNNANTIGCDCYIPFYICLVVVIKYSHGPFLYFNDLL